MCDAPYPLGVTPEHWPRPPLRPSRAARILTWETSPVEAIRLHGHRAPLEARSGFERELSRRQVSTVRQATGIVGTLGPRIVRHAPRTEPESEDSRERRTRPPVRGSFREHWPRRVCPLWLQSASVVDQTGRYAKRGGGRVCRFFSCGFSPSTRIEAGLPGSQWAMTLRTSPRSRAQVIRALTASVAYPQFRKSEWIPKPISIARCSSGLPWKPAEPTSVRTSSATISQMP